MNSPQRVHGYFVNWEDVFFFQGDSVTFNKFLSGYAKVPGTHKRLVVHTGKLEVRSPWDKTPRKIDANWQIRTNTLPRAQGGDKSRIDVWLPRQSIVAPKGLKVEIAQS